MRKKPKGKFLSAFALAAVLVLVAALIILILCLILILVLIVHKKSLRVLFRGSPQSQYTHFPMLYPLL